MSLILTPAHSSFVHWSHLEFCRVRLPPLSERAPPYEAPVLSVNVEPATLTVDDAATTTKLPGDTTLPAACTAREEYHSGKRILQQACGAIIRRKSRAAHQRQCCR